MKIIDFDAKFFEYARKWVAAHPGMTEKQIDESYNRMMEEWIGAPAEWLDGASPAEYFKQYSDPADLVALMRGYHEKHVNLPEPLYARIVELGDGCAPLLKEILKDENCMEGMRAEAMGMLRDISSGIADDVLVELVCTADEQNELSDMAADVLATRGYSIVSRLLDWYPDAPEYAQTLILDVCCNFPGDERIYDFLIRRLRNQPEQRALNASCLAKLGDPRAIEPMQEMLKLFDLRYFDYIELRDAVEALGGEVGEDRTFYGDPDYEALRNL
ncbi:MAG: hypothetical protein IJ466_10995 [Clostridia bacterium]|nr:hypothetical protein [Clostridia bacterium]